MSSELSQAYRDFPAAERWTYMDVAARGLLPRFARDALVDHLDERRLLACRAKPRLDAVRDRLHLLRVGAGTDDEEVGESGVVAEIEDRQVNGELVLRSFNCELHIGGHPR